MSLTLPPQRPDDDDTRQHVELLRKEREAAARLKKDLEATMREQATRRGGLRVRRGRDGNE